MSDEELLILNARMPNEFQVLINDVLKEGRWRIVQTEMSVSDHHYFAMLIKHEPCEALQSLKQQLEAKSKALEIAKELKESAKDLLRIRCETSIGAVECDIRDFEEALAEIESLEKESGE